MNNNDEIPQNQILKERSLHMPRLHSSINKFLVEGYDRNQIENYLNLGKTLFERLKLDFDDPRVVTSFGRFDQITINIQKRFVLSTYGGLLLPLDYDLEVNKFNIPITDSGYFTRNEVKESCWISFDPTYYNEMIQNIDFVDFWIEGVQSELDRGIKSPLKRYHKRIIFDLITDLDFRREILDEGLADPTIVEGKATGFKKSVENFPVFSKIEVALSRKGQVILFGPPGTGKTFFANLYTIFQVLLSKNKLKEAQSVLDSQDAMNQYENELKKEGYITFLTFHPSYEYEDFIEGFRPKQTENGVDLSLVKGIFYDKCKEAEKDPDHDYFIIIDEINRAHLTKVFGELITILELDKRGVQVLLPYSRDLFSIPKNIKIIGTMNTSDFSIRSLDIALRRRFGFVEIYSDPDLLENTYGLELELDKFLRVLNKRILRKFGREKQIGHAYFMTDGEPIRDAEEFQAVFNQDIIRLLEEYCHQDYHQLTELVGSDIIDHENQKLNYDIIDDPQKLIETLAKEFESGNDE